MAEYDVSILPARDFKKEIIAGLIPGIIFIILNLLIPSITIGIPLVSEGDRFLIVGILAPIGEEIIFRYVLPLILIGMFSLNIYLVAILTSIGFSLAHIMAYSGSFSMQGIEAASGAFFGAFLFGILAFYIARKNGSILPVIIMHAVFNIYLITKLFVVVGA